MILPKLIKKNLAYLIISIVILISLIIIPSEKTSKISSDDCYNKNFKVYKDRGKSDAQASRRAKSMCN